MQVNDLTDEEKQVFIEATKPVYEKYKNIIGADLIEMAIKANE